MIYESGEHTSLTNYTTYDISQYCCKNNVKDSLLTVTRITFDFFTFV